VSGVFAPRATVLPVAQGTHEFAAQQMVERQLRGRDITDPRVLEAMLAVPRHAFVPGSSVAAAYSDQALPTDLGQTISQPYVVARMTQLLAVAAGHRVLEIGTGSGYQAAVLAHLGASVVTVERHASLAESARDALRAVAPDADIEVVVGDGTLGYADAAPYDRILTTAAAPDVPASFRDQLAEGGRIVMPVGTRQAQTLRVIDRRDGRFIETDDLPVRFVPLIGEQGWAAG